jgi:hypothetical protein
MVEKEAELLQVSTLPERESEEAEPDERPFGERVITSHELDASGRRVFTDKEYCERFGLEADFKELRRAIEKRRASEPKTVAVRCPECGWRGVLRGGLEGKLNCLYCNRLNLKGGARLKVMSAGEEKAWRADVKREAERTRPAREAAMKARAAAEQAELSKLK